MTYEEHKKQHDLLMAKLDLIVPKNQIEYRLLVLEKGLANITMLVLGLSDNFTELLKKIQR